MFDALIHFEEGRLHICKNKIINYIMASKIGNGTQTGLNGGMTVSDQEIAQVLFLHLRQ